MIPEDLNTIREDLSQIENLLKNTPEGCIDPLNSDIRVAFNRYVKPVAGGHYVALFASETIDGRVNGLATVQSQELFWELFDIYLNFHLKNIVEYIHQGYMEKLSLRKEEFETETNSLNSLLERL